MNITIHPNPNKEKYTKDGKTVYRYVVDGTEAELANYKAIKDPFFKEKSCGEES